MVVSISRIFDWARPFLSLRSLDVTTPEGRARERQRRAVLSTAVAMAAKAITVATSLITVPLTLNYLGPELFGMWMTMSSVIAMLSFADLGIGNGLLNAIAAANGKDDFTAMRRYISSAVVSLFTIALIILVALALGYSKVPWATFFNVKSKFAVAEAGPAACAFVICFAVNIPASIIQRVQMGLQMGFIANLWQVAGSLIGLIAVLMVIHFHAELRWLVVGLAGAPVIAAAMNWFVFFSRIRANLLPKISLATRVDAIRVIRVGFLFFVLQIAVATAFLSDNFIITQVLGASAVSTFAVPDKLFSVIPLLVSMMLAPLWPAYGEAIARGDGIWVKGILKKSLITVVLVSVPLSIGLAILAPYILSVWIGHAVAPPLLLLTGLAVWKILESLGSGMGVFLNGANIIRIQIVVCSLMATCAIFLKFTLVSRIGVSGAVWATVIAYSTFVLVPYTFYLPRLLSKVLHESAIQ